ncbi:transposase [Streptomyces sp. NPDC048665]|uniref:transposase n=1 Tax=Streptomyces sp. NPDC048665 TaxID=3155490 RepID=UPI0034496BCE
MDERPAGRVVARRGFRQLVPARRPSGLSPAQLATVCVLQFLLRVPDPQAGEAVRCRIDFAHVLVMELDDAGFQHGVPAGFRERIAQGDRAGLLSDLALALLKEAGLGRERATQRTPFRTFWDAATAVRSAWARTPPAPGPGATPPAWTGVSAARPAVQALRQIVLQNYCSDAAGRLCRRTGEDGGLAPSFLAIVSPVTSRRAKPVVSGSPPTTAAGPCPGRRQSPAHPHPRRRDQRVQVRRLTSSDDYSSPTGAPDGDPLAAQVRPEFLAGEVDDALSAGVTASASRRVPTAWPLPTRCAL